MFLLNAVLFDVEVYIFIMRICSTGGLWEKININDVYKSFFTTESKFTLILYIVCFEDILDTCKV